MPGSRIPSRHAEGAESSESRADLSKRLNVILDPVDENDEIVYSRNVCILLFQNGFQVFFCALLRLKAHAVPDRIFTLHLSTCDGSVSLCFLYPLLGPLLHIGKCRLAECGTQMSCDRRAGRKMPPACERRCRAERGDLRSPRSGRLREGGALRSPSRRARPRHCLSSGARRRGSRKGTPAGEKTARRSGR